MKKEKNISTLNNMETASFCGQMSMMLSAGITVSESLRLLEADAKENEGKEILCSIYTEIEEGNSLFQSMCDASVFPKYVLDMVHIGEQTGNLDHVFSSLSSYYEREESIHEGIRTAITYPFIMIGMMLCVILVLMVKVLPIFEQVYKQLGSTMDGLSGSILRLGSSFSKYSAAFVVFFACLVLCYFLFSHSAYGKEKLRHFASSFVLTRELYDSISAGRFASGMALALGSGFNTEQGLEMVRELISNQSYMKKLNLCEEKMKAGEPFADAVVHSNIFKDSYGRMVAIGFKSGKLDDVMAKVASRYEIDVDYKINHFVSILEPTLVAILSIVVGMILLSVMLPLMGIMSSIG